MSDTESPPAHLRGMICVVGSPRSGTTWIGKTFDSHPDTLYRHEPDLTHPAGDLPLLIEPDQYDRHAQATLDYVERILAARDSKTSGILPVFPKSYYNVIDLYMRRQAVLASKLLKRVNLGLRIPDFVDHRDAGRVRLVWKTIESLGRIGLLAQLCPRSRFVHVVRHPCGHIASTLRGEKQHQFSAEQAASEDTGIFRMLLESPVLRDRGVDAAALQSMTPVQRLAIRWLAWNEQLMRDTRGQDNVMSVRYESICTDPVTEYRKLFEFCGLQYSDQTETFLRQSTNRDSRGYYSVVKDPARAMLRWQGELNATQVDQIMETVADSLPGRLFQD